MGQASSRGSRTRSTDYLDCGVRLRWYVCAMTKKFFGPFLAATLALMAYPVQASNIEGVWIARSDDTTIFRIELRRSANDLSATWEMPAEFELSGWRLRDVSASPQKISADFIQERSEVILLHFGSQAHGADRVVLHIRQIDENHAALLFKDGRAAPIPLVRQEGADGNQLGGLKPGKVYGFASDWPSNSEMTEIFEADQEARASGGAVDWNTLGTADAERRARVQELLDDEALNSGTDFFHAAFVFQHGSRPEDYLKAHALAMAAVARGRLDASWISAASLDRYLHASGEAQIFGTQYTVQNGKRLYPNFEDFFIPDDVRNAVGVFGPDASTLHLVESEAGAGRTDATSLAAVAGEPAKLTRPVDPASLKQECKKLQGWDSVVSQETRWILVGEIHGTRETPEIFGDLVCLFSLEEPVTVALEHPVEAQAAIDQFISSEGDQEAKEAFLRDQIWSGPQFGVSSEAIFDLYDRLRILHAEGRVSRVLSFQPRYAPGSSGFDQGAYEKLLADSLVERTAVPGRVLVLTGNFHARRTPFVADGALPMAAYLPVKQAVVLDAVPNGGTFWGCTPVCGETSLGMNPNRERELVAEEGEGLPYDAKLFIGSAATPSPPEVSVDRRAD